MNLFCVFILVGLNILYKENHFVSLLIFFFMSSILLFFFSSYELLLHKLTAYMDYSSLFLNNICTGGQYLEVYLCFPQRILIQCVGAPWFRCSERIQIEWRGPIQPAPPSSVFFAQTLFNQLTLEFLNFLENEINCFNQNLR